VWISAVLLVGVVPSGSDQEDDQYREGQDEVEDQDGVGGAVAGAAGWQPGDTLGGA
jgi:hypothetical protein